MNRQSHTTDGSYSFQVEIKVAASSKDTALEQLRHTLDSANFSDYRIKSDPDPNLAAKITKALARSKKIESVAIAHPNPLELRIRQYIENNKLIRLNVNKGLGVKMSIPCRIINFESSSHLLTVYHVDEKQVYSIGLYEIDDFVD